MRFIILFSLCVTGAYAACSMSFEDVDECASRISMFGNRNLAVPLNEKDLDENCDKIKKGVKCIGKFVKSCMSTVAQTMFGVMQYNMKKDFELRCINPEGRKEFLKHIKCGEDKKTFEPLHRCVDNYVAQIEWLSDNTKDKADRLGGMCCTVVQLHSCFLSHAGTICDQITGPETKDYFETTLNHTINQNLEATCPDYISLETCDKNLKPEIWKPLKQIGEDASKMGKLSHFHSPITVILKMFSNDN